MNFADRLIFLYTKNKRIINYIIFGALTTLVNFIAYFVSLRVFGISNVPSNIIAWIISVIFAFVVNKLFVFDSKSLESKLVIFELVSFVSVRLLTGVIETLIMYIGVDVLKKDELVFKIIASVIVLLSNYIGSVMFIFRRRNEKN